MKAFSWHAAIELTSAGRILSLFRRQPGDNLLPAALRAAQSARI